MTRKANENVLPPGRIEVRMFKLGGQPLLDVIRVWPEGGTGYRDFRPVVHNLNGHDVVGLQEVNHRTSNGAEPYRERG